MFVKLHNHSRIKSFLQSIYLKSSVHRLWIWQRIFPQSRFDFIPGNRYKNLAHSQQGSLFTLSFSFKTCDKYQIAHVHCKADRAAAHTALSPGVTQPPRCALLPLPCCRAACSAGFSSAAIQVLSWRTGSTGIWAHHHLQQIHDIMP